MAEQSNVYGVIASMLGVDAFDAADQDLILSSAFPMLKIESITEVTLSTVYGNSYDLVTHNLGYPPFFLVFERVGGALIHEFFTSLFETTSEKITMFDYVFNSGNPTTKTYVVLICRNPLNKAISTPVFSTQSREAALRDRNYGLITSKPGKSTDSTDMRDFTFHSNARNLLIHAVDYREIVTDPATSGRSMTWVNDLPYRPIFFGYCSIDGGNKYRFLYGGGQAAPNYNQLDNGDVKITDFDDGSGTKHYGSIWVFKDPFTLSASEQVTI